MITGVVTADREAVINLTIRGAAGQKERVVAVIDTGYDGWLTLPKVIVSRLGLTWRRRGRAVLADGSDCIFDIYEATVLWNRRPYRIPIDEADCTPLIGMAMLDGYKLEVEVRDGGRVMIAPLRRPGQRNGALPR